jgi:hypothetical protein
VKAVDFFPREFQWPLRYTLLPCLIVKKKLFMPMDVCEVMPGNSCTNLIFLVIMVVLIFLGIKYC